jgi:hypothetical protein
MFQRSLSVDTHHSRLLGEWKVAGWKKIALWGEAKGLAIQRMLMNMVIESRNSTVGRPANARWSLV